MKIPKRISRLRDLTPDSRNANLGTERGAQLLEQSLRNYGAGRSILVDRAGRVIAGNKTLESAASIGLDDVEVVQTDGRKLVVVQRTDLDLEKDPRAVELGIADNRTSEVGLEWDAKAILGLKTDGLLDATKFWTDAEIKKLLAGIESEQEAPAPKLDQAKELQAKWKTKRGQIWEIGWHRLMCGDCTKPEDVRALLAGAVPFLCVTDPPYGVDYDPNWRNVEAAKGNLPYAERRTGEVRNDDRADWSAAWKLFPGDVLYSWHPPGATSIVHAAALQDSGFIIRMQIIWAKSNFPIGRGDYHVRHEPCWYAVRKNKPAKRTDDRTQTTLWEINLDPNCAGGHSTQKPMECMARPIRNHDTKDVYDPFLGSGTTMCAADILHRRCHAMEIEPKYVAVALERMWDMGLKPKLCP